MSSRVCYGSHLGGEAFDAFYYGHCCGQPYVRNDVWLSFFGGIADRIVTDLEAALGTPYTYETVSYLRRRCPGVHFVWIMGADNLRSFHRWQRWRDIAELVPIAIVDRLGPSLYATGSAAAQALARYRLPEAAARKLADHKPPAWIYLHGLKSPLSSTALRAERAREGG